MNVSVQSQQFRVDALKRTGMPVHRAAARDIEARAHEKSSLLLVAWLGFGAVLTIAWAAALIWLASWCAGFI
jgi:hypothetical protein